MILLVPSCSFSSNRRSRTMSLSGTSRPCTLRRCSVSEPSCRNAFRQMLHVNDLVMLCTDLCLYRDEYSVNRLPQFCWQIVNTKFYLIEPKTILNQFLLRRGAEIYLKLALKWPFSRVNPGVVSVICGGGKCLAAVRMGALIWAFARVDS